jgi:arylsulfatase A-like enzyme
LDVAVPALIANVCNLGRTVRALVNVVYLHTHDSGTYLRPDSGLVAMPHIAELAASATSFLNAFSAAPTCSPSRSALLTGLPPHENGMVGLAHRGFRLNDYGTHLVNQLDPRRTERVLCGVQHVAPSRELIGYDLFLDGPGDYFNDPGVDPTALDRANCKRVVDYLHEPKEREFFLSFGLVGTHRPFPETAGPAGAAVATAVPDTPAARGDNSAFAASLLAVDAVVGEVVEALRNTGLWSTTAVVFTTDHGPPFPEMKGTLYDGGIATSLVIRVPGLTEHGSVSSALVSQMDLFPTILKLLGAEAPQRPNAGSLLPLLRGDRKRIREEVFAETNYHANYEPARAVRTERHKLIRRYGSSTVPRAANVDDSPSKRELAETGYFQRAKPREELFDLSRDPAEWNNRLEDPAYAQVRRDLAARLYAWMESTGDPILHGHVRRPEGSRVNREDAHSATEETVE